MISYNNTIDSGVLFSPISMIILLLFFNVGNNIIDDNLRVFYHVIFFCTSFMEIENIVFNVHACLILHDGLFVFSNISTNITEFRILENCLYNLVNLIIFS